MPPLTGEAVKETEVPSHTGFADAEIEILAGDDELTVIVTALDVAGLPETQLRLDVMTQVITSLFTGVYDNVGPVPTLVPFFFH